MLLIIFYSLQVFLLCCNGNKQDNGCNMDILRLHIFVTIAVREMTGMSRTQDVLSFQVIRTLFYPSTLTFLILSHFLTSYTPFNSVTITKQNYYHPYDTSHIYLKSPSVLLRYIIIN